MKCVVYVVYAGKFFNRTCCSHFDGFWRAADELCKKALEDAKSQLYPLLQNIQLDRLDQREEFVQSFKSSLEQRIAHELAARYPDVLTVFKYAETPMQNVEKVGSIHSSPC